MIRYFPSFLAGGGLSKGWVFICLTLQCDNTRSGLAKRFEEACPVYKFEEILPRAHVNFEEQSKVFQAYIIIIIIYCIMMIAYYNNIIV
jgi:hypothetical protein